MCVARQIYSTSSRAGCKMSRSWYLGLCIMVLWRILASFGIHSWLMTIHVLASTISVPFLLQDWKCHMYCSDTASRSERKSCKLGSIFDIHVTYLLYTNMHTIYIISIYVHICNSLNPSQPSNLRHLLSIPQLENFIWFQIIDSTRLQVSIQQSFWQC